MIALRENSREELRISVDEFRGHRLNLHVWFEADDGTMQPSNQGLAVRVELAADLVQAMQDVRHGG